MQLVKMHEPRLKKSEKSELWNRILAKREATSQKTKKIWWSTIAAAVVILLIGSWMLHERTDYREHFFSNLNLNELKNISLFMNDDCIELEDQATITCIPNEKTLEIRQGNALSRIKYNQEKGSIILAVPARKKTKIMLADGSIITMNSCSKMLVPLDNNKSERNVIFEGEAYMKIHHDEQRPFFAKTNVMTVKVLGTEFLLSAYSNQNIQSVTLIKGCVEVIPDQGVLVRMAPNQTYSYNINRKIAKVKAESNIEQLTSWKDNLLLLRDEQLTTLLQQIERLYGIQFSYDKQQISDIRLNGKLDTSVEVEQVLGYIMKVAPVRIEKRKNVYHIYKNLK